MVVEAPGQRGGDRTACQLLLGADGTTVSVGDDGRPTAGLAIAGRTSILKRLGDCCRQQIEARSSDNVILRRDGRTIRAGERDRPVERIG
jgi:hypothetical protein